MVVLTVDFGNISTWFTMDLQMLTGQRAGFEVECCVIVLWYMSFFCTTNLIKTESAENNYLWFVIVVYPFWKMMFCCVNVFVFRVPVILEYLHDRHAKKKAPLQMSVICL